MRLGELLKDYHLKCFTFPQQNKHVGNAEEMFDNIGSQRKPGGWRAMPYIIGNETFERLATFGMFANFTVYLVNRLHFPQIWAANAANIWFGTTNFAPLAGAFLSDVYLGRFQTLAYASVASFLGMLGLTMTASIPQLQPHPCSSDLLQQGKCPGPPTSLICLLVASLAFLTVGAGGIRPCSLPFGVDQFDPTTESGRKGINSFFNWYYFTFTVAIMIAMTLIVYIQDSISWAIGLGIPTALMLFSIVLFFFGTRLYVYVPPEGSVLSGVAQVIVAAYKKRKVDNSIGIFDPTPTNHKVTKMSLTNQFKFLNKAAFIVEEEEVGPNGCTSRRPWRLCSVQKVEELKCLIRIAPIWASGIICFTSMVQQGTFSVLQALKMDRHIGPNFKIPAGSLGIISMAVMALFIVLYDRALVPIAKRVTAREGGISLLQRMGVGLVVSVLSMVAAGVMEIKRRNASLQGVQLPVMWLGFQLGLMGVSEAFNGIAQIEFYYKEFPEHMRSIAGALFFCSLGGSSYLSTLIVSIVHKTTSNPRWLDDNIDAGRLDRFYYLLAVLGTFNVLYFFLCSYFYRYKSEGSAGDQVEMVAVAIKE